MAELSLGGVPTFLGGGAKALIDFKRDHKRYVALKSFHLKDGKVPADAEYNLAKASLAGGAARWFEKDAEPQLEELVGEARMRRFWELLGAKYAEPAPHERNAFERIQMGVMKGKTVEEDPLTFGARFESELEVVQEYFRGRQVLQIFIGALPKNLRADVQLHADGLPAPVNLDSVAQYAYNLYSNRQAHRRNDTTTSHSEVDEQRSFVTNARPPPPYCKGCDTKSVEPNNHRRSCWIGYPAQARPDWKPRNREQYELWEKIKLGGGRQQAVRTLVTREEPQWDDYATSLFCRVIEAP